MEQDQQKGVTKDGPLASLSVVKTAAVATFVGKSPSVDDDKRERRRKYASLHLLCQAHHMASLLFLQLLCFLISP